MIDGKVVGCPHHILEPVRTNLITYSEDFSNAYWYKDSISVTSGFVSPDGTLNASKIVGSGFLQGVINVVASNVYTYSVFWKKDTSSFIKFQVSSSGPDETITLNTKTLSFSSITNIDEYSVEEFGNGWYRLKITWTEQDTEISGIRIICDESDANSSLYIWGAQVEQGSYPTSYIPTNGSATTRSAETANGSGDAATFNDSDGVLMAEISALADDETNRAITLSDGTTNNVVEMFYSSGGSNRIRFQIRANGVGGDNLDFITTNYNVEDYNKIAIKYKLNDAQVWINGTKIHTDSSSDVPNLLSQIDFNYAGIGSNFYGNTKQIQYYNTTDIDLEQLTSWTSFTDMAEGQQYNIE